MIFNRKQIVTTLFVAGPLAAALLISRNVKNAGGKTTKFEIFGFLLTMLMYAISLVIIHFTITKKGFVNDHTGLMNVYSIGIIALIQVVYSVGIMAFLRHRFDPVIPKEKKDRHIQAMVIPYVFIGIGTTSLLILFGAFRFFFLLVYMIPHYYIFKRISRAFLKANTKRFIASLMIIFMLLFPVMEIIYSYNNQLLIRIALQISYFYLPFILHFFIGLFVFDILSFGLTELKILDKNSIYANRQWRTALGIIGVFSIAIVVYAHIQFNSPSYTTYTLDVPARSSQISNMKVIVASDFHFAEITSLGFVKKFVEKVNASKPDIVLFPGDIVESDNDNGKMKRIAVELKKIESTHGVYASLGNHEFYGDLQKNILFCKKAGMQMLMDTAVIINKSLIVAGQNDLHDDDRKNLDEILGEHPSQLPVILMRHRPIEFEDAVKNNVDIMVSGHTHHGQLFPFHLLTQTFYELSWGHKKIANTHFITTSGAQGWGPQARTMGKSEIVLINLGFK